MAQNASPTPAELRLMLQSAAAAPITAIATDAADRPAIVRGEITIKWPCNRFKQTIAFGVADPYNRAGGHVRLQFRGPVAETVVDSGLGAGDGVVLSLEGAEIGKDNGNGVWNITLVKRALLLINPSGRNEPTMINFDDPSATFEDLQPVVPHSTLDVPPPQLTSPVAITPSIKRALPLDEYHSPAFIKRARVSYGSLFDGGLDIFAEVEKDWGRRRTTFGRPAGPWRYTSRSRSPEPEKSPQGPSQEATNVQNVRPESPQPESPPPPPVPAAEQSLVAATPPVVRPPEDGRVTRPPAQQPATPPKAASPAPQVQEEAVVENGADTALLTPTAGPVSDAQETRSVAQADMTQADVGAFGSFLTQEDYIPPSLESLSATAGTSVLAGPSWPAANNPFAAASASIFSPFSALASPNRAPFAASHPFPSIPPTFGAPNPFATAAAFSQAPLYNATYPEGPDDGEENNDQNKEDDEEYESTEVGEDYDQDDEYDEYEDGEDDYDEAAYPPGDYEYVPDEDDQDDQDDEEDEEDEERPITPLSPNFPKKPASPVVIDLLSDSDDESKPKPSLAPSQGPPTTFNNQENQAQNIISSSPGPRSHRSASRRSKSSSVEPAGPSPAQPASISEDHFSREGSSEPIQVADSIRDNSVSGLVNGEPAAYVHAVDRILDQLEEPDRVVHAVDMILDQPQENETILEAEHVDTFDMAYQEGRAAHGLDVVDEHAKDVGVDGETEQERADAVEADIGDGGAQQEHAEAVEADIKDGETHEEHAEAAVIDTDRTLRPEHERTSATVSQTPVRDRSVESLASSRGRMTRSRRAQLLAEQESQAGSETASPPQNRRGRKPRKQDDITSSTPQSMATSFAKSPSPMRTRSGRKAATQSASPEPAHPSLVTPTPAARSAAAKRGRKPLRVATKSDAEGGEHTQSPTPAVDQSMGHEPPARPSARGRPKRKDDNPASASTATPVASHSELFGEDPSLQMARERTAAPGTTGGRNTRSSGCTPTTPIDHLVVALQQSDPSVQIARAWLPSRRSSRLKDPSPVPESAEGPASSSPAQPGPAPDAQLAPDGDRTASLTEAKLALIKDLRSSLPGMASLKTLRHKPNMLVDIICVAALTPTAPQRQKSPQHLVSIAATDPGIAPSGIVNVALARPEAAALPVVREGDVLLARRLKVQPATGARPPTLRSTDGSSWAVFERGRDDGLPQIRGPPVEWTREEQGHAEALGWWWGLLDGNSLERLARAASREWK